MKQAHFLKNITLISQIGISMLTAVGMCLALGIWVDHKFGTNFLIWFLFLGVASGYRSAYNVIKKIDGSIGQESKPDSEAGEEMIQSEESFEQNKDR
ncbi:MAG: AtpZ/AtpI family protein [Lachnospiraceae bacterium]|nr:AtpZ/AtpI family protein [Lachnospiraceae bacterium]